MSSTPDRFRSLIRRTIRGFGLWIRTPAEGLLLARMLGWRVVLPALKRVVPLQALARLLWSDRRLPGAIAQETVVRLAEVAYKPGPTGTRGNCLERSLVAYRYLARAQANPTLVVGVRPGEGAVHGHTWVLVDGHPVHDSPELLDHEPLVSFGAGGNRESSDSLPAVPTRA